MQTDATNTEKPLSVVISISHNHALRCATDVGSNERKETTVRAHGYSSIVCDSGEVFLSSFSDGVYFQMATPAPHASSSEKEPKSQKHYKIDPNAICFSLKKSSVVARPTPRRTGQWPSLSIFARDSVIDP